MKQTHAIVWGVVAVAVAASLIVAYYELPGGRLDQVYDSAYSKGQTAGAAGAGRYIPESDITMSASPTVLNYTSAVNASDDIATQTWQNTTLTISNDEETGYTTVLLTLQVTGEDDGLPDELEQNEFQVLVHTTSGDTWLFGSDDWDGEYHGGYKFDISANQQLTLTLSTTMDDCNDVFEDGKTHHISVYLYEYGVGVNGAGKVIEETKLTLNT